MLSKANRVATGADRAPSDGDGIDPPAAGTWCRAVLDHAPIGVLVFDADFLIGECNDRLAATLGHERRDLLGRPLSEVADASLLDAAKRALSDRIVSMATSDDGRNSRWASTVTPLVTSEGSVIGGVVIAELADASERARLVEHLMSNQRLVALGQLACGVAHDFNNLITAISTYAELVLGAIDGTAHEFIAADIREITRAASSAADLTRQLQQFARRQARRPTLVCANTLILEIERMLGRLVGSAVSIEKRLASDLPFVLADVGQLEQVLVNLVINARDAMPGGGTVVVETQALSAGSDSMPASLEPRDYAVIGVHDTGQGMDAATMQRIFEPFFTTKDPTRGTGMGLATVESIVTKAGGVVSVRSMVGKGSSFTVYLPAA